MRLRRRGLVWAGASVLWFAVLVFVLLRIGPGFAGGPVMAADLGLNVQRMKLNDKSAAVRFNIPPGSQLGKIRAEAVPGVPGKKRLILPYTDFNGVGHRIAIGPLPDLMSAAVELDPTN